MQPVAQTAAERWIAEAAGAREARIGPLLGGGNANVTRLVETDRGRLVLRHPPAAAVSDKAAAGVRREWELLRAVHGAARVPRPVAFCEDSAMLGAPFLLVEHVEGVAIADRLPPAYPDDAVTVSRLGEELVDALAAVHRIDWRGRLPERFGRPEGFLRRQIDRWLAVRAADRVRELPLLGRLGAWLRDEAPADGPATLIHCDYHLDNTLFARDAPRLAAIIDWEMATLGPPLVDLGLLTMFWNRNPAAPLGFPAIQRVSTRAGAIPAHMLAERWRDRTGLALDDLAYYQAFAFWRLAAIVEGAYVLQMRGEIDSAYARGLAHDVPALLAEAAAAAGLDPRGE